jgi:hypothetical protein
VAHSEDWRLHIVEFLDVRLEKVHSGMSEPREYNALDIALQNGLCSRLVYVFGQLVVRKPAQSNLDPVLQRKRSLLYDGVPVPFTHERQDCPCIRIRELFGNLCTGILPIWVSVAFGRTSNGHGKKFMRLCGFVASQCQIGQFGLILEDGQSCCFSMLAIS